MKSKLLKLLLSSTAIAGIVFVLRSQTSTPAPSKPYDTYGNDGRYRLVVTTGSYGDQTYVIDTQSGRLWHGVLDTQRQIVVLETSSYENMEGQMSTLPNETATSFVLKKKDEAK